VETLLPGPAPHLSIGYGLTMGQPLLRPFAKSVKDEASGTTLSLKIDESGFIEADCFAEPDTISIVQYIDQPYQEPCPKPKKPVKKGFSIFHLILAFTTGFTIKCINSEKFHDRFKNFVSKKLRR
jgi:hypothetical protein